MVNGVSRNLYKKLIEKDGHNNNCNRELLCDQSAENIKETKTEMYNVVRNRRLGGG